MAIVEREFDLSQKEFVLGVASLFLTITAQSSAPAPTSDGAMINQGIACLLMLVALVLTYLIH
ncbi:hypothetical protein F8388_021805 [Cannabis sativa]|uniref:Uncharacterized protein n=1 Tax=Cannabis sativa TaxID=3483 RepID=A0A7J6E2V4_CANSA|nr:hypothetical protein F8388_021805 [Cannabis sativa]